MTDKALLEKAIKDSGYKKSYLAERLGLSRAGFSNCLSNKAEFKASQIATLCELLQLDTAQRNSIFFAASGG